MENKENSSDGKIHEACIYEIDCSKDHMFVFKFPDEAFMITFKEVGELLKFLKELKELGDFFE